MGTTGMSFLVELLLFVVAVAFGVICIVVPFKLWSIANRVSELREEARKQTALLERLASKE
ncbi:MAG: hypothetical protein P8Z30_14680 [Acidobacteriota bacterium]